MQDCIEQHLDRPMTLQQLAHAAGYSPWHATRLFREEVGISPSEYLRARRLARAALELRHCDAEVGETAIRCGFGSHEGFTRAFVRTFALTPEAFRKGDRALELFMPRSARLMHLHKNPSTNTMITPVRPIFVQLIHKPARALLLRRGTLATEYWSYCEECGCDVWGTLASLRGLDEPMGMWLPESLRRPGTSEYVMGLELSLDDGTPTPSGFDRITLEPCDYLVFQGQPYPEEQMGEAIAEVVRGIEAYDPGPLGWAWATDSAPRYQLAPMGERGYIEARPVRRQD